MANQNAQIIKLARSTRAMFENDTSALPSNQPIMCLIYGEGPMVVGFKVNGAYRYIQDQHATIDTLVSTINANTNSIASLSAAINAGARASIGRFGDLSTPLNEPIIFPAPSTEGIKNPLLYTKLIPMSGVPSLQSEIAWIWLATDKMRETEAPGQQWMRWDTTGGTTWAIRFFLNETDADNEEDEVAHAYGNFSTPGLFPILDEGDGETVWGWVWIPGGASHDSQNFVTRMGMGNQFTVPASLFSLGGEIRFKLKFFLGGYGHAPTLDFELRAIGSPLLALGEFSFDLRSHGIQSGYVLADIIYEIKQDDYGIPVARTWMELRAGDPELAQVIDVQPQMDEKYLYYMPPMLEGNFPLSLTMSGDDNEGSPTTFHLYSAQVEYAAPPQAIAF